MKISFADLDPCTNASCKYHSHCVALSPNRFTCVCESSCPSYEEQVCTSNGRTFPNLCLLKQEICRTRGNYTKYHPGSCEGTFSVINKSWFSLIEESFSLWVQINKHEQTDMKIKEEAVNSYFQTMEYRFSSSLNFRNN